MYIADSGVPDEPYSGRILQVSLSGDLISLPLEFGGLVGDTAGETYYFGLTDVEHNAGELTVLLGLGSWLISPLYSENRLISIAEDGSIRDQFDVGSHELEHDPDGEGVDSNASGFAVADDGVTWVTDAAGNWAARLVPSNSEDGSLVVSAVAVFPAVHGEDAVPTGIAEGPDGNAYVTLFRCQQPTTGKGGIARVLPDGSYEIVVTELSNPIDVAFDASGRMYVLEFAVDYAPETGRLSRIEPDGQPEVILDDLTFPTSLAISSDGDVYVTEIASPAGGPAGSGKLLVYDALLAQSTN